ncbi:MAG: CinA family protein [Pseudomonadota bacterium]
MSELLRLARYWGYRISTAESCTGGMVAAALTDAAGSSDMFERGFVTYSNQAKIDMLGVSPQLLAEFGAVSESVAAAMAEGALAHSLADIAVSTTGIAGPGGSAFKTEGRVCFGLAVRGQAVVVETVEFGALGRDKVRIAARDHALGLLLRAMA